MMASAMNAMDATIGTTMWQCKQKHVSCRATIQVCNIHAIHTLHGKPIINCVANMSKQHKKKKQQDSKSSHKYYKEDWLMQLACRHANKTT